jgi:hypothetical protein
MALTLSAKNLFQFISYISPFLLAFTFILIGFMNGEPVKPIIYLGVLSLTMGLVVGLLKFNTSKTPPNNPACKVFDILTDSFYRPSMSTYFIAFTLMYTLIPMLMSGGVNYYLISFILLILGADTVTKFFVYKCMTLNGLLLGGITALVLGSLSSVMLYNIDSKLVFFGDDVSNRTQCSTKGKKFVCRVYKNGRLITTT